MSKGQLYFWKIIYFFYSNRPKKFFHTFPDRAGPLH